MFLGVCLDQWGVIGTWATAVIAAVAIYFAISGSKDSKRTLKHSIVESLYKEYGSSEMAESVLGLHTAFRASYSIEGYRDPIEHERRFIDSYKEQYNTDPKRTLHWQRRTVSLFYQRMAFLCQKDKYLTDVCTSMWGMDDLGIVRKIIIPIETIALPELLGGTVCENEKDYNYSMKVLSEFAKKGGIVKRNPWLSGLLSLVVPGLGQVYAGEGKKGGAIIFGAIVIANLNVLILPLISMANPTIPLGNPDSRSIWAYFIPRLVHDVASFWSIAYWVWAVVDAIVITKKNVAKT